MKKIILVTGANGQLGRAVNELYRNNDEIQLYNTDICEMENIHALDITNIDEVTKMVAQVKPYAIINCAAHTNVDGCEKDVQCLQNQCYWTKKFKYSFKSGRG